MSTTTRRRSAVAILFVLLPGISTGCADDHQSGATQPDPLQVVLDYSPTLSDAGALLYLASSPAVELVAVTLPGTGEADCEPGVRTTRALLAIAGRPDVPVGCGRDAPLIGTRDWPEEWRTEVNRWGAEMLPPVEIGPVLDAEQLLVDTLSAATTPLTIVAVAPLTNLGVVLAEHPELAPRVERIVIMGGAVTVAGNVEAAPTAEWNLYIDPEAARRVIQARVPIMLVPLDATNAVPWTERLVARFSNLDTPAAHTVQQLAASRPTLAGFYLWDELAAIAAIRPDVVTVETRTVIIDDDGAVISDPGGVSITVAIDAQEQPATDEFLRTLNNGILPEIVPLTADEWAYMVAMNGADGQLGADSSHLYNGIDTSTVDPRGAARAFIIGFLDAVSSYATALRAIDPPASVSAVHTEYVDAITEVAESRPDILDALQAAEGTTAPELIEAATTATTLQALFDHAGSICQRLEDYSFAHGGPRPCSGAADR